MKSKLFLFIALCLVLASAQAQVDLVNKVIDNKSENAKNGFQFTTIVDAQTTPVENQGASGTCWSYSTNSFLESEMIKAGKQPVPLSKIYSARCVYLDKAENYVRMHGAVSWGDGGEPHDVINMFAKYGAMPESAYTGLHYGTKINKFDEMQTILKAMLDAVVQNKNGTLTPVWKDAFGKVLDTYLGEVPQTFTYNGKEYTPRTFASEVVGIDPDNYVEFISETNAPYWKKAMMMVPDNWAFQWDWNIPMEDITGIIDNALKKGYTVAWGADVSEPYFSWKNGIAYVPEQATSGIKNEDKAGLFDGPKPEMNITPELRQQAFDNYSTTDDHGMQITGIAKDQNGREYYIVKNSWGTDNDYNGFLYVTKAFVQYKTTSFLVNRNGVPDDVKKKLGI
jgi:bleomycin hydrolase